MQNQEPTRLTTPLDKLDTNPRIKHDPALTWLIAFGAYSLLVRFVYAIAPLMTSLYVQEQSDIMNVYEKMNLIFSLGNIALSIAILINVNNTLCRVIFAITVLMNFYSMVTTLFLNNM